MKFNLIIATLVFVAFQGMGQNAPKVYDPCQKLDTNTIKKLILGTWVEVSDTSHVLMFTEDSLTESILINEGGIEKKNISYWSYKFTDNMFSSDDVTCYSLYEYKEGYAHHTDFPINALAANYMLLGSTGKKVYKRKN